MRREGHNRAYKTDGGEKRREAYVNTGASGASLSTPVLQEDHPRLRAVQFDRTFRVAEGPFRMM